MTSVDVATMQGRTVLITGGTGSFGKQMVRRLLDTDCDQIRVFSRDEGKHDAMRHEFSDSRIRYYIGDVRDYDSVARAVRRADHVFHAAALKQVPSGEFFPMETMRTNVLGSSNVMEACEAGGVPSLVCLSTDKAVYPVNAMGMTKALMEKVAQAHARNNKDAATTISCVRYGNVMYSRGSVIPLFVRQIKAGNPVTVTEPSMTRFMMSLADSVDLVEHAFANARPGDIFIRKAPACTVGDLALALFRLFDVEPRMEVLGIRHGEKLYETLASREELAHGEDGGQYWRVPIDTRDLNYAVYFEGGNREEVGLEDYDSNTTDQLDVEGVMKLLRTLPDLRDELSAAGRSTA